MTIFRRCYAPGVAATAGPPKIDASTNATAGARKASTARRRPGTVSPVPVRRGLDNMRIQAFLTAAAINMKRLAAALVALLWAMSRMRKDDTGLADAHPA